LEFNVPFQHKYGYIRDEVELSITHYYRMGRIINSVCVCTCVCLSVRHFEKLKNAPYLGNDLTHQHEMCMVMQFGPFGRSDC